jgi:hypothetical protein
MYLSVTAANAPTARANGFIALINNTVPPDAVSISTAGELAAIGGAHGEGKYFVLANDITLTAEWTPIEDFRGVSFDGRGHTINNLYVLEESRRSFAGLFGQIRVDTTIRNVGINIGSQGITTVGTNNAFGFAGGLIGSDHAPLQGRRNVITIENCYVRGGTIISNTSISATSHVGGLIGRGNAIVTNSYATNNISNSAAYSYSGGLVGRGDATITNSYATGNVSASSWAGGLVGGGSATITNSYATGNISATANINLDGAGSAGGLVGLGSPVITDSHSTGTISATFHAGGLIGRSGNVSITNSYSSGNIITTASPPQSSSFASTGHAGGLIGYNHTSSTSIINSYATGSINASGSAGGLVGVILPSARSVSVEITNSYTTGNISTSFGSAGGLIGVSNERNAVVNTSEVISFTITDSYSTGSINAVDTAGGIIGNTGYTNIDTIRIIRCFSFGNISASGSLNSSAFAGGLVGRCSSHLEITNSYARGSISASSTSSSTSVRSFTGGLVGRLEAHDRGTLSFNVNNSYATGNVFALSTHETNDNSHAGGLIGEDTSNSVAITNSYRLSTQEIRGNSILRNTLGSSLTNEQMRITSSFVNWDFNTVWQHDMTINDGYPYLRIISAPQQRPATPTIPVMPTATPSETQSTGATPSPPQTATVEPAPTPAPTYSFGNEAINFGNVPQTDAINSFELTTAIYICFGITVALSIFAMSLFMYCRKKRIHE